MDLSYDELVFIEEAIEEQWDKELVFIEEAIGDRWDDANHYPNDHSTVVANTLYQKVQLAKKQLKQ